jgi:acyl-CoA dehydrogenase
MASWAHGAAGTLAESSGIRAAIAVDEVTQVWRTVGVTSSDPRLPPPRSPDSWAELPFFFEERHSALGERVRGLFRAGAPHAPPEEANAVTAFLAASGLFELVAPASGKVEVRALCVAREAMAYVSGAADAIFAVQGLSAHPVLRTPDALGPGGESREAFLDDVRHGRRIGAFALTEPEAGSDVGALRTQARLDGEQWVLDGDKCFISNVGIAHHLVVFANADPTRGKKGISAFLVDAKTPGVTFAPQRAGGDHPLGRVALRGARVPRRALLGDVGHGLRLALGTLDVFRTSVGAAAVGMARRALDEALRHVTTRTQFEKRLSDFQLTQAALADMATELDAARLLVYRAAWRKDTDPAAPASDVAMAKLFATEAAFRIIDRAVQLHGGLGVLEGTPLERLTREVRPLRIYEGTSEIQKLIIGGALTAQ